MVTFTVENGFIFGLKGLGFYGSFKSSSFYLHFGLLFLPFLRAFSAVIRHNFSKNNIFFQANLRVEFCGISAVEELCKSLEAERWFKSLEAAEGLWKSLDAEILCRKEVDLFRRYCECARLDLKHLLKGL